MHRTLYHYLAQSGFSLTEAVGIATAHCITLLNNPHPDPSKLVAIDISDDGYDETLSAKSMLERLDQLLGMDGKVVGNYIDPILKTEAISVYNKLNIKNEFKNENNNHGRC